MRTRVRPLDDDDLPDALALLGAHPVENLFLLDRIQQGGLKRSRLGCPVYGAFRHGDLVGLVHVGSNLVPVADDEEVLAALAARVGPWRTSTSIMGTQRAVLPFHEHLTHLSERAWGHPRAKRTDQPLLVIDSPPAITPDPRVRIVGFEDFESYFRAAVDMYTEEVGVSPLDPSNGYRRHMLAMMQRGDTFGILDEHRTVRWKSDVALSWSGVCQIQGVWLDPTLRGQRLSAPAMAGVVQLARRRHHTVTLYVNDFNVAARGTYDAVGFRRVGTMTTILY